MVAAIKLECLAAFVGIRNRGRAIALADLEWKSEERGEKHRPYPRSDASFPGRAGQPEIDRAVATALDGLTGADQVFDRPERVAGKLRRTPPRRIESRDRDHRRDSQFLGEPPDETLLHGSAGWSRR